jgi:hypothetical protein
LDYKKQGIVKNVEILAKVGCPECKKLNGKKYSVDEALNSAPLPNKLCLHKFSGDLKPFCRCCYLTNFD